MTATKWGTAVQGEARSNPSDEIKELRELLLAKGVITEEDAKPGASRKKA